MSTAPQILANRANAQSSTGPQTASGKARSSQNSLRHGLASGRMIIQGEDPEAFNALVADFIEEHNPATPTEQLLVEQMAQNFWLAQRAIHLQQEAFLHHTGELPASLAVLIRYQTANERGFYKALDTLSKLQKTRAHTDIGFASQRPQVQRNHGPEQEQEHRQPAFVLEFQPPDVASEASPTSTG